MRYSSRAYIRQHAGGADFARPNKHLQEYTYLMKITVEALNIAEFVGDTIIVHLFEGAGDPSGATGAVDQALGGAISQAVADGQFKGKLNSTLVLHTLGKIPARRVVLVGLGKTGDFTIERALARQRAAPSRRHAAPALAPWPRRCTAPGRGCNQPLPHRLWSKARCSRSTGSGSTSASRPTMATSRVSCWLSSTAAGWQSWKAARPWHDRGRVDQLVS